MVCAESRRIALVRMSSIDSKPGLAEASQVFGGFRMDSAGRLFRGEEPIELEVEQGLALRVLLDHAGQIVTPIQLRRALWKESTAPVDGVARCIAGLRAKLKPGDCIEEIYKRGYRISSAVRNGANQTARLPRLAVLPLAIGKGVPEYLGSAIAEDTAARLNEALSQVAAVLAQDSVTALTRRKMDPQQIAVAMNADLLLQGRLSASASQYRLSAEMWRAADGSQLWIEDLLMDRSQVAELAAELANRVRMRLGAGLSVAAFAEPEHEAWPGDGAEYEMYQQAHYEWPHLQRHAMQDSLQRLLHVVESNPRLFAARVDIANLCMAQAFYGYLSSEAAAGVMRRVVDPFLPGKGVPAGGQTEAEPDARYDALLPAQGWFKFYVARDLPGALEAFERAAYLPHNPCITRARSVFALSRQHHGEAIDLLRAALRVDPYSRVLNARLGWALHLAGEAEESVKQAEHSLREFPEYDVAGLFAALILAWNGEAARAVEIARQLAFRAPYFDLANQAHACALARAGRRDEARELLEQLGWLSRERFVLNAFIPATHVALGQYDEALEELRVAGETRSPWFFLTMADPQLKPLHDRPEFQQMAAILTGMEEEARRCGAAI